MDIELKQRLRNMLPEEAGIDVGLLDEAVTQKSQATINQLMTAPNMIDEQIRQLLTRKPQVVSQQQMSADMVPASMPEVGRLSDTDRQRMLQQMQDMQGSLADRPYSQEEDMAMLRSVLLDPTTTAQQRNEVLDQYISIYGIPQMQEGGDPMMEMMGEAPMSEEEMQFIGNLQAQGEAPMFELASQLAQFGRGGDDQIVHAETGDVIIPPQVMEADEQLSQAVFDGLQRNNINPEERVVGSGIASLNPETGLQEFGWLKKTFKKVGKFVKKAAPIAMLIPGVGTALGAVAGSLGSGIAGLAAKIPGIGGALSSGLGVAGKAITSAAGGLGSLISKVPGMGGIGQNIASLGTGATAGAGGTLGQALSLGKSAIGSGIQSLISSPFKTLTQGVQQVGGMGGMPQQQASSIEQIYAGADPSTQARIERLISEGASEQQILANLQQSGMIPATAGVNIGFDGVTGMTGTGGQGGGILDYLSRKLLPQSVEDAFKGQGGLGQLLGGAGGAGGAGGGFGLGDVGAFGLAGLLGKLAYEEAKNAKGVPLTPLVTMGPTGRYNIEAEIARRTGQPAPNPVEFGLLPSGTIPELTGGKAMGGAVQGFFQGGSVAKMNEGGELEIELDMNDFERMNGGINGEGTETSDDIPAMLSDGEFVMTGRAVRGAGSYELQKGENGIISLIPSFEEDRERGTQLMYQIMDMFAESARAS